MQGSKEDLAEENERKQGLSLNFVGTGLLCRQSKAIIVVNTITGLDNGTTQRSGGQRDKASHQD
jgi:hypothetical protein